MTTTASLAVAFLALAAAATPGPLPDATMGRSEAEVAPGAPVVPVPNSWEETTVQLPGASVLGRDSQGATVTFYNHRAYRVEFAFGSQDWDPLVAALTGLYGETPSDKTGTTETKSWLSSVPDSFGGFRGALLSRSGATTTLSFRDDTQKDFHLADLTRGALPWIIATIVGFFVLGFLVTWALGAWCSNCKAFSCVQVGRDVTATDVSPHFFETDIQNSVTYKYKCTKCGRGKVEHYRARHKVGS